MRLGTYLPTYPSIFANLLHIPLPTNLPTSTLSIVQTLYNLSDTSFLHCKTFLQMFYLPATATTNTPAHLLYEPHTNSNHPTRLYELYKTASPHELCPFLSVLTNNFCLKTFNLITDCILLTFQTIRSMELYFLQNNSHNVVAQA